MLRKLLERGPGMRMMSLPRARQRLHTMPTSAGYETRTDPSYDWDGRRRGQTPFTVLQCTVAGAGNLRYGNRIYRLMPGETMLVLVPHAHRYWVERGGRWEFFWISMHGTEALRIHREVLDVAGPVLKLLPETVDHLADCVLRLLSGSGDTPARASAISYEASMALYDDVFRLHAQDLAENPLLKRVVDHIAANLGEPLPVEALARLSGLSRAHFSRMFTTHEGIPPAEYVLQKRLDRAVKLLTKTADLSVKEVSSMCGFQDPNYFAKAFRRAFGASPTEFRSTGMYASIGSQRP